MWSILLAILAFGFLIFVHELAHYIAARIFRVKIYEFSIGMGPRLFWYQSKKTGIKYSIAMLPFGGFVNMAGEHGEEELENASAKAQKPASTTNTEDKDSAEYLASEEKDEQNTTDVVLNADGVAVKDDKPAKDKELKTLLQLAPWKRIIIMAAGGIVNIIVGFVLLLIVVACTPIGGTTVAEFPDDLGYNVSSSTVLQVGDEILRVDGVRVRTANELDYEIMRKGIEPLELVVLRDGEEITLTVTFPKVAEQGQELGTRDFVVYRIPTTFSSVFYHAFWRSVSLVKMVWESIFDLVTGRYSIASVSGPIGVTGVMTDMLSHGFIWFVSLVAMISVNLGVMNLMPIPALDGGRIVFVLIEMIRKKPVPRHIENNIHATAMLLLLGFMIFITIQDIGKLF